MLNSQVCWATGRLLVFCFGLSTLKRVSVLSWVKRAMSLQKALYMWLPRLQIFTKLVLELGQFYILCSICYSRLFIRDRCNSKPSCSVQHYVLTTLSYNECKFITVFSERGSESASIWIIIWLVRAFSQCSYLREELFICLTGEVTVSFTVHLSV